MIPQVLLLLLIIYIQITYLPPLFIRICWFIFLRMSSMYHPDIDNVFPHLFSSYRILPADQLRIRKYLPLYVPCLSFVLFSFVVTLVYARKPYNSIFKIWLFSCLCYTCQTHRSLIYICSKNCCPE